MKRAGIMILLAIMLTVVGCATVGDIKGTVTTKVAAITSSVDPNLVAKIPAEQRNGFTQAESAVKLAEEILKLAQMKSEMAAKQEKFVHYEEELIQIDLKDANLDFDILKMQAIDASGLGKKEDNSKTLTNLKVKKVNLQADRIRADSNMAALKRQMAGLAEKIKTQEEQIKGLTSEKGQTGATVPAQAGEKATATEAPAK